MTHLFYFTTLGRILWRDPYIFRETQLMAALKASEFKLTRENFFGVKPFSSIIVKSFPLNFPSRVLRDSKLLLKGDA